MASKRSVYNFITLPDDNLKCAICFELANKPKQHEECGKLYCSKCIDRNGARPCPVCRTKNPKYFLDSRGKY